MTEIQTISYQTIAILFITWRHQHCKWHFVKFPHGEHDNDKPSMISDTSFWVNPCHHIRLGSPAVFLCRH